MTRASSISAIALWMTTCLSVLSAAQTWHIDPLHGSDANHGDSTQQAWKSFRPLNALKLGAGDEVVIAPGIHETSLVPKAEGSADQPVRISFLPGTHEFSLAEAHRRAFFISNSCSKPESPMPIGIMIDHCKHLTLSGDRNSEKITSSLLMGGRMTHFINDHSEDIYYENLRFDLKRPTVSEFRVTAIGDNFADIQIAEGSTYEISNNKIVWTGDLGEGAVMTQEAIPAEGRSQRLGVNRDPLAKASAIEPLGGDRYRVRFDGPPPLQAGHQFQFRNITRDVVGAYNNRCKNIRLSHCEFNALTGMGIISQFTDGITYDHVRVVPPAGTLRTCPAWADVFHFSGCRGQILVNDCEFSGTQDDAINVHGTYLRIIERTAENQLLLRFMHKQTYGFAAFQTYDEVAVINSKTLLERAENPRRKVIQVDRVNDQDWKITLDGPTPEFQPNDVIDNITWYPDVTVQNCHVDMNSCRGFLLSTRGKALIENNTFKRCKMPAILIGADANGWFESGSVSDMTIRKNTFIGCGIDIDPRVMEGDAPVHHNIRIEQNKFLEGASIKGHHATVLLENNELGGILPSIKSAPESTQPAPK